jgi:hypothetical protein
MVAGWRIVPAKRRLFERKFAGIAAGRAPGRLKRPSLRSPNSCAVSTREDAPSTVRKPQVLSPGSANESKIVLPQVRLREKEWGDTNMNSLAIMENVRRYRTIASLYRQTAAFRPVHSCSLLAQAREWEHRAVAELEAYFDAFRSATSGNAASRAA